MRYLTNLMQSNLCKKAGLLNAVFGGLMVTLPAIPTVTSAQTVINPCPRIYYEEPFNSDRRVPEGCPPNAATLQETGQGAGQTPAAPAAPATPAPLPVQTTPTIPEQSPSPDSVQPPSAFVTPANNTVNIELVNNTSTNVTYEVIGQTDQRSVSGRSQITLRGLQLPLNMTFVRPDGGFVTVTPQQSAPGVLTVTLVEALTVDAGQGAMNIQRDGNVYLN